MLKEDKEDQANVDKKTEEAEEKEEAEEETAEGTDQELEEILTADELEKESVESEVAPTEEEKIKPRKRRKKEEEEEFVEERIYNIPLGKARVRPRKKRAPRAMQMIKDFVTKHMKLEIRVEAEEERAELPRLMVSNEVNEKVWSRSIEKPPRKIRVRVAKDKDGNVTVFLAEGE